MLLKSYISNRIVFVKHQEKISTSKEVKIGVPQGRVLGPTLYTLYIADKLERNNETIATFTHDIVVIEGNEYSNEASSLLQIS